MAAATTRAFELRGTRFLMVRQPRSTLVAIYRSGRVPRFLGYIYCDPQRPDYRFFPGYGGWDGGPEAWRWMADGAKRFYRECIAAEVVVSDGR